MALIFLSYRRSDSPQACRVYDWLVRRFGADEVFMDVSAIPAAVDFSDFIHAAVTGSRIVIVLIGRGWTERIQARQDPVRLEIQAVLDHHIPLLPVLIGDTPMPDPDHLPAAIADIARQNAATVGVSQDFHTHMQTLLPRIESLLGQMARHSRTLANPDVVYDACNGIVDYLKDRFGSVSPLGWDVTGQVVGTSVFNQRNQMCVTLFMHRAVRLGDLLELHFILSIWGRLAVNEHRMAGWVMHQLERTPTLPATYISAGDQEADWDLKLRTSDDDPRSIWKMITGEPLRLSLAYVATVTPRAGHGQKVDPQGHGR